MGLSDARYPYTSKEAHLGTIGMSILIARKKIQEMLKKGVSFRHQKIVEDAWWSKKILILKPNDSPDNNYRSSYLCLSITNFRREVFSEKTCNFAYLSMYTLHDRLRKISLKFSYFMKIWLI